MSKIWRLNNVDLGSALLSAFIISLLTAGAYVVGKGSIYGIDWKVVINLAIMTCITSLIKSFSTDENGKFLASFTIK